MGSSCEQYDQFNRDGPMCKWNSDCEMRARCDYGECDICNQINRECPIGPLNDWAKTMSNTRMGPGGMMMPPVADESVDFRDPNGPPPDF